MRTWSRTVSLVEERTGLGVRRADQAAEQVDRLACRARVPVGPARGRPPCGTAPRCGAGRPSAACGPPGPPTRRVGAGVGDPADALLRAGRNRGRERVRATVAVEEAEVVGAGTAPRDLQRVALHPAARLQRLLVGQLGPGADQLARLLLHQLELRALVSGRVPRQHHPPDPLVVLTVADDRQSPAAGVAQLGKKLMSSTRLPNCSSSVATHSSSSGSDTTTNRHRRAGTPDRIDVAEPVEVLELGVVVVEDVEVRVPLSVGSSQRTAYGISRWRGVDRRTSGAGRGSIRTVGSSGTCSGPSGTNNLNVGPLAGSARRTTHSR